MDVLGKARDWMRERKERAQERQRAKEIAQGASHLHGHSRFWLLTVPATATILAAITEWYWALLFCIEATGHIDWNFETGFGSAQAATGDWNFAFAAHLPVLVGLIAATAPIVMLSMVWLPVQFAMRGSGRWRRGSIIAVGILANILVIVSGTVVMNYNRQEQVREGLVVEQQAEQSRAGLEARRAQIQGRLDTLTDPSNTTLQAQAARAGAVGWDTYIETARRQATEGTISQSRLALIERARGSAVAAEEYQRQIDDLTVQIATAPTQAAVAANVEDTVGAGLNGFAQVVEVYRPPFIAVICTLIGIFGTWWVMAMLEHMNPRDVLRSGWAPEELRIEDHSKEAPIPSEPMKPAREVVTDAETGEELVKVKPKEYWRKRGAKKGRPTKIELTPDVPPDERGVATDGGSRIAMTIGGPVDLDAPASAPVDFVENTPPDKSVEGEKAGEHSDGNNELNQDVHSESSDDTIIELPDETEDEAQDSAPEAETEANDAGPDEAVEQDDAERVQPETNPARMIAAE